MLHYVHQVVVSIVCFPFGGEQVLYSGFLETFCWKQFPAESENNANRVVRMNQNSKVVGR